MACAPEILKRFAEIYPRSATPQIWRAPGRVNLIGEHTDYNLGFVLPMAIDLECVVASARSNDGYLRVYSEQLQQGAQWPADSIPHASPTGDWSDRVIGIAWELSRRGVRVTAQNILITSTVPLGGGLSSSAALGISMLLALGGERPPLELAQLARATEMDFVGVPCGIMDQFISAHGGAIFLDCRSLAARAVTLPRDLAIVTANSMVKHELADSAYRTRVAECAEAARFLGIASLRDASLEGLHDLSGVLLKRARHVVTENLRVEGFRIACEKNDLAELGRLATASHQSLRDDYEVSCPELDVLVEAAIEVPGVLGARMTGAGFGGSIVIFAQADAVDALRPALLRRTHQIHLCIASAPASRIFL